MAIISKNATTATTTSADPLFPFLLSIEKALNPRGSIQPSAGVDLDELVSVCIETFKNNPRYKNDARFLKIWFLHMDARSDYESVFAEMEQNKICLANSLLYESYALFLEAKGRLIDAFLVYHLGISRNAEPIRRLKKAQVLFLERVSDRVTIGSIPNVCSVELVLKLGERKCIFVCKKLTFDELSMKCFLWFNNIEVVAAAILASLSAQITVALNFQVLHKSPSHLPDIFQPLY